jgi:hypothetical protein
MSLTAILVFRPNRQAADAVFSTAGLVAVAAVWRSWKKELTGSYRPELHYMRGPGPKWRAKHAHAGSAASMSGGR